MYICLFPYLPITSLIYGPFALVKSSRHAMSLVILESYKYLQFFPGGSVHEVWMHAGLEAAVVPALLTQRPGLQAGY